VRGSGCLDPIPWETRNLGLPSFAVGASFLEHPDGTLLPRELADLRHAHARFFVQARFPPDTRTSQILEANGFYFVEATVSPSVALAGYAELDMFVEQRAGVLPKRYERSSFDLQRIGRSDHPLAAAVRTIAGESFVDDRFHVDHNCPAGVADARYRLWVDDMFDDETVRFDVLLLDARPIAFMASRRGDLLLAGFAPRYVSAGLGEYFWLRVLERLRSDGVARVRTLVSVSNVPILNLYARLNFKFRDPQSTFHLWVSG